MITLNVTLPSGRTVVLPDETVLAIQKSAAKYPTALWDYRIEKVLKLSANQWVFPDNILKAQARWETHSYGISCLAWKLFNRGYSQFAQLYPQHPKLYPDYPSELGRNVIPLVDEDAAEQHVGWVRVDGTTHADSNYAVFIEFTLLQLFEGRPLLEAYK